VTVLAALFAVAATVLLLGGALKAVRTSDTVGALAALGVTVAPIVVSVGGLGEAVLGAAALTIGGRVTAALVAASYLAFAVFVIVALVRGAPISSCGCLGRIDTPPTVTHLVIDLAGAAVAIAVAVVPDAAPVEVLDDQPLLGIPFTLAVAVGVAVVLALLAALPRRHARKS
jgi:uncharacterized membrane protein